MKFENYTVTETNGQMYGPNAYIHFLHQLFAGKAISGFPPPLSFDFVNEEKAEQPNYLTLKGAIDR